MNHIKPWYTSKTVLASLVAISAMILNAVGFQVDDHVQRDLTEAVVQSVGVFASLVAIAGRISATKRIG